MRVISLFSGCGGLDYGFHKAGFKIVYANDISNSVRETYEYNLGPIEIRDIREVDKSLLPDCNVVVAGIPCQPFSTAGNRGSMDDKRGTLFSDVITTLNHKKPEIVLLENVRGFLSSQDDSGISMISRVEKELKECGYALSYKLLNASDYNVPQNRYRVIMIGTKNKTIFKFPDPVTVDKSNLTIGSVLAEPCMEEEVLELSPQSKELIKHIPEGGCWKDVPYDYLPLRMKKIRNEMRKYHSPTFYRRFSRNQIVGTITATATPENSGIIHPTENRRYSVREIARFQSFPDDFKFIGSTRQKYKMIGNAVPVNLAYYIAKKIMEDFYSTECRSIAP